MRKQLFTLAAAGLVTFAASGALAYDNCNTGNGGYGSYRSSYSASYSPRTYGSYSSYSYHSQQPALRPYDSMSADELVTLLGGMDEDAVDTVLAQLSERQLFAVQAKLEGGDEPQTEALLAAPTVAVAAPVSLQTQPAAQSVAPVAAPAIAAEQIETGASLEQPVQRLNVQPRADISPALPFAAAPRQEFRPQQVANVDPRVQRFDVAPAPQQQRIETDSRVQRFNAPRPQQDFGSDGRIQRFNAPRPQETTSLGDGRIQRFNVAPRPQQQSSVLDGRVQRFNAPRPQQQSSVLDGRVQRFNAPRPQQQVGGLDGRVQRFNAPRPQQNAGLDNRTQRFNLRGGNGRRSF